MSDCTVLQNRIVKLDEELHDERLITESYRHAVGALRKKIAELESDENPHEKVKRYVHGDRPLIVSAPQPSLKDEPTHDVAREYVELKAKVHALETWLKGQVERFETMKAQRDRLQQQLEEKTS